MASSRKQSKTTTTATETSSTSSPRTVTLTLDRPQQETKPKAQPQQVTFHYPGKDKKKKNNGKKGAHRRPEVPNPSPMTPPLFNFEDEASRAEANEYLRENGYAVFENVLDPEEIETALGLLWRYLEGLGTGIKRDDPETWDNDRWPPCGNTGILYTHSVGQSEFLWYLRGRPRIARIFAYIWQVPVEELLTSFDGCCVMRPTSFNPAWKTATGWYHFDQNGLNKPGDRCFQGLINLLDASEMTSPGLVVCPKTLHQFDEFFARNPSAGRFKNGEYKGDFVQIKPHHMVDFFQAKPKKLCIPAGAFVVWNSRTIHCNTPTTVHLPYVDDKEGRKKLRPERVVAYICMSPRPSDPEKLEELIKLRKKAVRIGQTTTHWPDEFILARERPTTSRILDHHEDITPKLNDHQRRLAGLD